MHLHFFCRDLSNQICFLYNSDTNVSIPSFNLRQLLPETMDKFYRYKGSLTTPPCYESVTWTVFENKIKLSSDQV